MFTLLTIFFLQFVNKAGSDIVCLSPVAQQMRVERGITIDSLDYAVSPLYLDSISRLGAEVLHTSRWFNGATVKANEQTIQSIKQCTFVDTIYLTRTDQDLSVIPPLSLRKREVIIGDRQEANGEGLEQLAQLNLLPLHQAGYNGQDIRVGVADGGFYNADILESLPRGKQWLGYADLTDSQHDFFGPEGNHGTLCLSAIMGQQENYQGAATQAEYFLFRTEEHYTESPKEIDNWVAAIEMADSLGLHIVSTSLGYTTFDQEHFNFAYDDMDGRTSRGAQASLIAARKGMLLVTAMGNEGNKDWHYLSTPADADSILSVGAVNQDGQAGIFSSFGPSADGRVKPEVCAMGEGTALINPADNTLIKGNGTSFACPLIAGMAASLWSALPNATNMEIREIILRSCDRYNQPDMHLGYGIPDVWKAYTSVTTPTHTLTLNPQLSTRKIIHNGQLYILHDGKKYNVMGYRL